jgi:hypothetical protein
VFNEPVPENTLNLGWPQRMTRAHLALRETLRTRLTAVVNGDPIPRLVPNWTPEMLDVLSSSEAAELTAVSAMFNRIIELIPSHCGRLCLCHCSCGIFFFSQSRRGRPPKYFEECTPPPRDGAAYARQNRRAHRELRAGSERAARHK